MPAVRPSLLLVFGLALGACGGTAEPPPVAPGATSSGSGSAIVRDYGPNGPAAGVHDAAQVDDRSSDAHDATVVETGGDAIIQTGDGTVIRTTGVERVIISGPPGVNAAQLDTSRLSATTVAQWGGMAQIVPYQRYQPLGGRVVGLMLTEGRMPWGAAYDHMRFVRSRRQAYRFHLDGSSPWVFYFPSPDGSGENFLRNWSVPTPSGPRRYDAARYGPFSPNPYGLDRRAFIAEVEVNSGQGASRGLHFVATNVRVLDGTPTVPYRADEVLTALATRFNAEMQRHAQAFGRVRAQQVMALPQGNQANQDRPQQQVGVYPTYRTADGALVVYTFARFGERYSGPSRSEEVQCPVCPPGAPCIACDPWRSIEQQHLIVTEMAIRQVVDRSGALVEEAVYLPRSTTTTGEGPRPGRNAPF